jgi:hypothetical protein
MPMLPVESLIPLAIVALLLFTASLHGLAALGHFPRSTRQEALLRGTGPVVLWGSIVAVSISVIVAAVAAWWLIPWYAATIAGGIAILAAPLMLQYFSDAFVDGRAALLYFAAATSGLAVILGCYTLT